MTGKERAPTIVSIRKKPDPFTAASTPTRRKARCAGLPARNSYCTEGPSHRIALTASYRVCVMVKTGVSAIANAASGQQNSVKGPRVAGILSESGVCAVPSGRRPGGYSVATPSNTSVEASASALRFSKSPSMWFGGL